MILLDNGHGIRTRGKRSSVQSDTSQLFEFEFNRDIVRRVDQLLTRYGYSTIILVPEIEDISLPARCARANHYFRHGSDNTFLVSIHANAGGGTGWEVFTSPGETESDKIADIFFKEAECEFPEFRMRKDLADGDYDKEAHFYILKNTIGPAILTENFFMDTAKDLELIMSEEGRQRIAKVHVNAIMKYIQSK